MKRLKTTFAQRFFLLALLLLPTAFPKAVDLGTHNGCNATDAQFKLTRLFQGPTILTTATGNGALKMAFVSNADKSTDVYFIQKRGAVKRYNGKSGSIDSLGVIAVDNSREEQGLLGIAIRGDFLAKPQIYMMYSSTETGGQYSFRVSRFSLTPNLAAIDKPSEKILMKIKRNSEDWHTGGAMTFDDYGDLWGTVGDNKTTQAGPGNTADMRGGIYRIHPDTSTLGYSIPADNFGAQMAGYFLGTGDQVTAAAYRDTSKVLPELYVKGTRNAYSITVHPVRRWLAWGDVGPDQGGSFKSEEHNLVKQPVYAGWPYFAGLENMATSGGTFYDNGTTPIPAGSTKAAPVNTLTTLKGVAKLPPVRDPIFSRTTSCAITGPVLRYDGLASDSGIPPQLNGKWLNAGCDQGFGINVMTLNAAGDSVVGSPVRILQSVLSPAPNNLVDLQQGPDGAIYYVTWQQGIYRLNYTGTCRDVTLRAEKTGCADPGSSNYDPSVPVAYHNPLACTGALTVGGALQNTAGWLKIDPHGINVNASGPHRIEILDLRGRLLHTLRSPGPSRHAIPALPAPGLYLVKVTAAAGTALQRLSLL